MKQTMNYEEESKKVTTESELDIEKIEANGIVYIYIYIYISLKKEIKNNNDLYETIHDVLFMNKSCYYNTIYPIIINGRLVFAWYNSKNCIHLWIKDKSFKHYRFNKKKEMVFVDGLYDSMSVKRLIEEVKRDNKMLIENNCL